MTLRKFVSTAVLMGVVATSTSVVFAAPVASNQSTQRQVANASISTDRTQVNYSEFLKPGYLWVDINLNGASFTTTDPSEIMNAISTNYDIDLTLALKKSGGIELGHYERSPQLSYQDEWVITIDKSVLSVPYDLTTTLKVKNDIAPVNEHSPAVVANKSISAAELERGVVLTLELKNAQFARCNAARYIVNSIQKSTNIGLNALTNCYTSAPNKAQFYVKATGVPYFAKNLTFTLDAQTTTAGVPLTVNIPITR